jgi:hypothetical protein
VAGGGVVWLSGSELGGGAAVRDEGGSEGGTEVMLGIGAAGSERLTEAVVCGGDDLKLSDANKKYEIPPNATMMIAVPVISLALRPKPLLLKSILASGLVVRIKRLIPPKLRQAVEMTRRAVDSSV